MSMVWGEDSGHDGRWRGMEELSCVRDTEGQGGRGAVEVVDVRMAFVGGLPWRGPGGQGARDAEPHIESLAGSAR